MKRCNKDAIENTKLLLFLKFRRYTQNPSERSLEDDARGVKNNCEKQESLSEKRWVGEENRSKARGLIPPFMKKLCLHENSSRATKLGTLMCCLLCKVPYSLFSDSSPIALLHYMDTGRHVGHFDALVARSKQDCVWNLSTVITRDVTDATVTPLAQVSVAEVFSNALPSCDICASTNEALVSASSTNIQPTNDDQRVTATDITLTESTTSTSCTN
jgi:hypothetical protein